MVSSSRPRPGVVLAEEFEITLSSGAVSAGGLADEADAGEMPRAIEMSTAEMRGINL